LLLFGLIFLTVFVAATALAVAYVRLRRRQLAEAQAYARIRALRGFAERQREIRAEPAPPRLRAMNQ